MILNNLLSFKWGWCLVKITSEQIIINLIIGIYIIQRLYEVILSKKNESFLKENYNAKKLYPLHSFLMKLMHVCWFISLIMEANIKKSLMQHNLVFFILLILCIAQIIRFISISKLGAFWTIHIMQLSRCPLYSNGFYKIIRHPNYFAVILEFIFLPLLFEAFNTLIFFSLLNFIILMRRIALEESELVKCSNYAELFKNTKKIIPFIY